jgi:hypothetical protein
MKITVLPKTGTAAKFMIHNQRGDFMIALSSTLCRVKWQLADEQAELDAATQMAQAIVGRQDPALPFKPKYIFGDHNTEDTLESMVKYLHKNQL